MQLEKINANDFGIEESKANELIAGLPAIISERDVMSSQYDEVVRMDILSPVTAKAAKELRLKIKDNRTKGILVWHKTTKEFFLRGGSFVDAVKNKEIAVNERMEANLESIENHLANLEKERKSALKIEREKIIGEFVSQPITVDLGEMDADVWKAYLTAKKTAHFELIEAANKAEAERLEVLRVEAEAREAQRLENIRLKAEAEEREKAIEAERKAQAKIRNKRNEDLRPYIIFIRDYNKMLGMDESEYQKEFSDIKIAADQHYKFEAEERKRKFDEEEKKAEERAILEAKLAAEQAEARKLSAELQAKKDSEQKAEAERIANELQAKKDAEKLAKAPVKAQMTEWVDSFSIKGIGAEKMTPEQIKLAENIMAKFSDFKSWAKSQIESL